MASIFLLFKTIIFLLAIIFLIKITLTYMKKYTHIESKSIQVIERLSVNKDSSISIMLICGKYYLMSMTASNNELIRELEEEDVAELLYQKKLEQESNERRQEKIQSFFSNKSKLVKKEKRTENEEIN